MRAAANDDTRNRPAAVRGSNAGRQIGESVLLPCIAALLPWQAAWPMFRALAKPALFFAPQTEEARAVCASNGFVDNTASWTQRHRLTRIVDHIDPALSLLRGDRFIDRHVVVAGDPVPAGPCMLIGFHYGTGLWTLRHLRRLGHRVSFVAATVTAEHYRGQPMAFAFMRLRKLGVERAGGAPVITVGGSVDKIRAALRAGTSVLGLIDVPEAATSTVSVRLLGRDVQFPDGLLRIGVAERVPLIGYVASLDASTGARRLRFTRLPDDPAKALHALAALLDAAIRADPAAWHFWSEWPRLAARTTDPRGDGTTGLG